MLSEAGVCAVIFVSHPAQKEQLITAHIIGLKYVKPSSSQSLIIALPCSNAAARRHVCAPAP